VSMVPEVRMGVNYLEFTVEPRVGAIVYDRAGSAASTIKPDDFDWSGILRGARVAHTDGIFPGLGAGCAEATVAYLRAAREQGCLTTFDVNYREHLWTEDRARVAWSELLPLVDVLVTNRSVSEGVFGFSGSDADIMRRYAGDFGCKLVCLTTREMMGLVRGAWSSQALYRGDVVQGRRYEFDIVDRFGTGDAYMAGVLYGYFTDDAKYMLDFGDAMCALAHTIEGDVAQVSAGEVEAMLSDNYSLRPKR
jgi:2-dehydro-3-deoxygluconokinase